MTDIGNQTNIIKTTLYWNKKKKTNKNKDNTAQLIKMRFVNKRILMKTTGDLPIEAKWILKVIKFCAYIYIYIIIYDMKFYNK